MDIFLYVEKFIANSNKQSARYYKVINEIPTVILILVVLLVVFKPNF